MPLDGIIKLIPCVIQRLVSTWTIKRQSMPSPVWVLAPLRQPTSPAADVVARFSGGIMVSIAGAGGVADHAPTPTESSPSFPVPS